MMKNFVETLLGIVFFVTVVLFIPFAVIYVIIDIVKEYFK